MKTMKTALILVAMLCLAGLAACSSGDDPAAATTAHVHEVLGGWKSDSEAHWQMCYCGEVLERVAHVAEDGWKTDGQTHWQVCFCGEALNRAAHSTDGTWHFDADNHWQACICGRVINREAHSGGTATTEEQAVCETCGQAYGELAASNENVFDDSNTGAWN